MNPAQHISISINRPPHEVYQFTANPLNLPKWAAGLSGATIRQVGDHWVSESSFGKVLIRFAETNPFGVMDHDVTLPNGEVNHNPFRVLKNETGSEVVFTLFKLPRMSDSDYEQDARQITKDLATLKKILEA